MQQNIKLGNDGVKARLEYGNALDITINSVRNTEWHKIKNVLISFVFEMDHSGYDMDEEMLCYLY